MKNHLKKKILYQWLDGELKEKEKAVCEAHLSSCRRCQDEIAALKAFSQVLKASASTIHPSESFELNFREKLAAKNAESWLSKLTRFFEDLRLSLPVPSFAQSLAAIVLAVFIGGTGGLLSSVTERQLNNEKAMYHLSGFDEYKGIPTISLTGTYLKLIEGQESSK